MAIIYTYPTKNAVAADKVLISDSADELKTKQAPISSIKDAIDVVDVISAGSGISVSNPTGNVTIGNTGVLSLVAGSNISLSGSTGNITISTSASNVDGSGTTNRIPRWTDSNTLADSSFLQTSAGGGVSMVGTKASVYIGSQAGAAVTSAALDQYNVAIGDDTLVNFTGGLDFSGANTSGENVALGYKSLSLMTGGTNNVGVGVETLGSLTLGANNIALGKKALFSLTGARGDTASNVALGFDCLGLVTTGKRNVAVGQSIYDAKTNLQSAVALGYWAGKAFTGDADESVVIGASSLISSTATSAKNSVIIGESAAQATSGTLADDILIGTSVFNATVSAGSNIAIGRVANQNAGGSSALTGSIAIGTTGGANIGSGGTANSYSTVIGSYDSADAAVGSRNSTTGKYSAVIGGLGNSNAADYGMIVGGRNNSITTGASNAAILGGFENSISGTGSAGMALGSNLIVAGNNQIVVGRYNVSNTNTKFIVGAGTSAVARKNVFEVLNTGQAKLAQYETSSGASFPQSVSADFTFITAGGTSGDLNQLTKAQAAALPRYLTPFTRDLSNGDAINLPSSIGNLEILTWTEAAGSAELRMPGALPSNRVVTFTADSSVGTSTINIKFAGATIATVTYTGTVVNQSWNRSVTLFYNGSKYFVISNNSVDS